MPITPPTHARCERFFPFFSFFFLLRRIQWNRYCCNLQHTVPCINNYSAHVYSSFSIKNLHFDSVLLCKLERCNVIIAQSRLATAQSSTYINNTTNITNTRMRKYSFADNIYEYVYFISSKLCNRCLLATSYRTQLKRLRL